MERSPSRSNRSTSCVKLYLCSNPEDSVVERRALRESVFPRLRERCRQTLGLDIRVIDPYESSDPSRWPDQDTRQQLIQECRESSAGPFLLALVGHQYGSGSLPGRVEVAEYQQLLQQSQRAGGGTRPLERLYRRNENTEPPSYRLQPHTQAEEEEEEEEEDESKMKDKEEELKVFQSAVSLCVQEGLMTPEKAHSYYRSALDADLRFSLESCRHADIIGRCLVYVHKIINATGLREEKKQSKSDSELQMHLQTEFATPDQSSALMKPSDEHLLSQLCDNFLPGFITSCHLLVYTTTTECDRRHGYTSARRRGYAESLCQQVYADLLGLIDSWIGRDSTESPCASRVSHLGDALAREWAEQEELCALLSRFYDIVRPEEDEVRAYVEQKDRQCSLVVTGGPCTGKTVLIAHCAQQIKSWLADRDPVVISCFSNLSVNSSPRHLLSSLCYQIAHSYSRHSDPCRKLDPKPDLHLSQPTDTARDCSNSDSPLSATSNLDPNNKYSTGQQSPTVPEPDPNLSPVLDPDLSYKRRITNQCFRPNLSLPHLKEHLSSLLSLLPSPQQPLVLILDGLDQIKKNYRPQIIQCLPCPLPPEVKLILTSCSNRTHALEAIKLRYQQCNPPPCTSNSSLCANKKDCVQVEPRRGYVCVELNPVDRKQRANMLASLLSGSRRRVTSGQQALLNRALTSCSLTLYARLLHIHTSLWSSDSEVAESSLPDGVHSSISALLDHLEQKHGFPLVTRALSYLTLSRTGLTEAELTDLLSIDDEVLAQYVHQGDAPPSKMRVPQVDVERLLLDLKSFLIRRTVGVTQVLFWVSRHFELVLGKRYLGSHEVRKEIHSAMVDYFSGRWACGRAKPLPVSQESGANKATTAVSTRDQMKIYLDRQPAGQPFVFKSSETSTSSSKEAGRVNLRKILELPHHLQESNRWEELEQGLMMSLGFHQAMACAGRVGELVAMLEWKEGSPQLPLSRERALLASILKSSACLLQSSPLDLPTVIETRLLPYLGVYPELEGYIREIRQERRKTGSGIGVVLCPAPSAVPSIQCLPGDGGTKKVFVSEAVASECGTVVEVKSDGSVWIWKACGCDVVELSLNREQNKLKFAGVKSSGRFILLLTHCNKLFLWDMQDLDMLLEVKDPLKTEVTPHTLSKIEGFVACQEKFCVCWKGESFVSVFDLSTEPLTHFQCPSPVTCVICSSSGSYMYCGQEKGIVSIFDISTYSLLGTCSNPNENAVRSIILCEDKWEMSCIDSIGNISLWSVEAKTQGPFLVKESFSGGNTTKILSTDYSYNIDTLLLCEAHQISLWDTCKWELWDQFLAPQGRTFTQAALTQDGPLFLALLDTCPLVMVWRISTGECVLSLDTGANTQPLTLLRAATNVVSITHDGCLTAWDSEMIYAAGTAPKMGSGVVEVVAEPMGDWFYVTDRSEMVWRWSLQAETPDANFLHDGPVEKLCLSPDNIQLVTLSAGEIYIWQTETGQNTVRIRGSKAKDILVTPNSNIGVSLVERGLSQVWKLANGGIVCHIHLYLAEAQVSPESTFLFGLRHGDLLAASLWSGSISKRFSCAEWSEHVVAFHMLPEHPDFVVVMAASGAVYTWKVTEETVCRHFQLPYTVHCQPQVFQISSNGNYALLSIDDNVITFMDLSQPRLSSLKAEGPVLKACLEKNGCYAVYITHTTTLGNGCVCDLHSKPLLITVRLADGGRVGRVCLCKNPLTLDVCEQLYVFVGFEDGSVGVYYIPDIVRNGGSVRRKENLIGQKKQFPCDREPLRCLPMAVPNVLWP
ncbi:NACHT and WD repeat domain-containing protein 2 isoform X2 [Myripristis murdjan]|uniref:NACHT and WD repeat domain-containing protein 2 isoform X2 n=1 Tax=Myripristis murdjan TaxID=586833 RepID=UPI0011760F32|nr:NACHT and WD repeat domain-containing protein 2-like isoform X2 [Myripristis murdjan]